MFRAGYAPVASSKEPLELRPDFKISVPSSACSDGSAGTKCPGVEGMELLIQAAGVVALELALFASVVFLIFGIDDLAVDALWFRGIADNPDKRFDAADAADAVAMRFVVAIPAWRESHVIGPMLATAVRNWPQADISIIVGTYANDLDTMRAVALAARADPRIRMAINPANGPSTKGACLNTIWRAAQDACRTGLFVADALLIHDAEDLVDPLELVVLADALDRADYAQLPVVPLMTAPGRWIARHYCDEFAEAHGKEMPVRSAIGAPLPTAGVGCAFRMNALRRLDTGEGPFSSDCLTEDYELGVRLSRGGATGRFVRAFASDGRIVASRAMFPHRLDQSVRQKTRWLRGIALDGWDRLGWQSGQKTAWLDRMIAAWMLWRDRRVVLAAAAIACGYAAMLFGIAAFIGNTDSMQLNPTLEMLMMVNMALLTWRLGMRGWQTARIYGAAQGIMAVLRQPVSNIILVMTAWRALLDYRRGRRGQPLRWDKTDHLFPDA